MKSQRLHWKSPMQECKRRRGGFGRTRGKTKQVQNRQQDKPWIWTEDRQNQANAEESGDFSRKHDIVYLYYVLVGMRCDIAIGVAILLQRVPRSEKRLHSCHQDRHYPSRVYKLHRPKQLAFARQLCGLPPCCCFRSLVLPTWRTRRRLCNRSLPVCQVFPILAYKRQQGKKTEKK